MFFQVFVPREPLSRTSVAIWEWTHQFLTPGVHLVDFTLMTEQAARIREALHFVAVWIEAFIWTVMFVHVFAVKKARLSI